MRIRVVVVTSLVFALITAGCSVFGGGTTRPNEWTLVGTTPDAQHLLITTFFGGAASGCARWEGWGVNETADRVEVTAQVWHKRSPGACTDDAVVKTMDLELGAPLGDRDLVGCGTDTCLATAPLEWVLPRVALAATPQGEVVVAGDYQISGIDGTGKTLWQQKGWPNSLPGVSGDAVVTYNGRQTIARDPTTGQQLWSDEGSPAAVGDGTVLLCRGNDAEAVALVDGATGAQMWSADVPCDTVLIGKETVIIVAGDRDVDGGSQLLVLDARTGDLLLQRMLDDGIDDQVDGFDGAVAAAGHVVVGGQQADLVLLGSDGEELARDSNGLGTPIGYAGRETMVVGKSHIAAVDPNTNEVIWSSGDLDQSTVTVSGDALWALYPTDGTVARLDPQTGEPMWTAPIGISHSFAVASNDTTTYVATALAVIALDTNTGEQLWWQHIPYQQPSTD
jgi:outer membrane protein assembly factor BamB